MRRRRMPTILFLLAAVVGCDDGGLEPAGYNLGQEIVETFAAHVGENPADITIRDESWKYLRTRLPEIAEAIEEYVDEAEIAGPAWTEHYALMPHLPGVIHAFTRHWGTPPAIQIRYGGIRPGCFYVMPLERLEGGGWRVGEPEKDCNGFTASMPWRLQEDGKWVLDPK